MHPLSGSIWNHQPKPIPANAGFSFYCQEHAKVCWSDEHRPYCWRRASRTAPQDIVERSERICVLGDPR